MNRILFLIILSFISNFHISAQEDKKAKGILDRLSAKTRSYSSIKTEFSYSLVNKDRKINSTQNWKLTLKGDKYRLEMGDQLVISDGVSMWKVLKTDKEVELSKPSSGEEAMNPKNIFTMYEKGFRHKYIKEEKIGSKLVHTIDLFPINPKEKDYSSIRLYIDKNNLQVMKSEIKGKNGNVYTYEIKKFTTNDPFEDAIFKYRTSEFPGFELNDIR